MRIFHNETARARRHAGSARNTQERMTIKTRRQVCNRAAALAIAFLAVARPGWAATASELFAEGNRLFREDLYHAALLRYEEAAAAGMDTPLLHYNIGVASFKSELHTRARDAFVRASAYAPLTAISHYNLGLNARAIGSYDEARDWFLQAANQQQRPDIAELAARAGRETVVAHEESEPAATRRVVLAREKRVTNFDFSILAGAGVDDNVFRTPSEPYTDLADPANPVVTPEIRSGMYIPVDLFASYQVNARENEGFFGSYRFAGRFYQDKDLNNADEHLQEVAFGSEFSKRVENRATRVYSAFKIAQHDENYYDPDNGLDRVIDGVDISEQFRYLRYGPELWALRTLGRYTFGFRAEGQLFNYEEVVAVPEYDHEYWLIGLDSQVRLSPTSLLRIGADYRTRRFGDRPSYELDGTQPPGSPPVRYDYLEFSIEARQRITGAMWFAIGYSRLDREDRHVGYNSYARDEYALQFHLMAANRFSLDFAGRYYNYNYDNAFAFHDPAAGRKTLERVVGSVTAAYRISETLEIVAQYLSQDTDSNDSRIGYTRGQAMLSVRWSQ